MAVSVGQDDDVMSTINITPFTDVLLVLLIIFIILAAVTKEPNLPDARNRLQVTPSQIVVIISDKNSIQIGSNEVAVGDTYTAFTDLQTQTNHAFRSVIIKASPTATYGTVLRVMDAARKAGLVDFGLANHVEGTPNGATQ
ncbi:MAG TPA: biopolymer transporter ExbD [Verrucomicrobiae bacterium]|nr:biopolymer transporter ExbD [Verrucomicrobiae bacterium]